MDRVSFQSTLCYIASAILSAALAIPVAGLAQDLSSTYVGGKECQACHKDRWAGLERGPHGQPLLHNPQSELAQQGCEACHGPGSRHLEVVGGENYQGPLYLENFRSSQKTPRNSVCLQCHESDSRTHWRASAHNAAGLACNDCHTIHTARPATSTEVCARCHKREQAKLQRTEHMPLREGRMTCNDCHDPHGGVGPRQLKFASTNDVCYQCHAEKRGPQVFDHPPVRENCALCHDPHGSNHAALLVRKPPYLCQSCHQTVFHVGDLYDQNDLPGHGTPARQMVIRGCVNCHSQIHGSSHPAGARFQR